MIVLHHDYVCPSCKTSLTSSLRPLQAAVTTCEHCGTSVSCGMGCIIKSWQGAAMLWVMLFSFPAALLIQLFYLHDAFGEALIRSCAIAFFASIVGWAFAWPVGVVAAWRMRSKRTSA